MQLILSINIDGSSEQIIVDRANYILQLINSTNIVELNNLKCSLVRDGDRSGGNLLLPKLQGRIGEHYQGRKASIQEVLNKGEQ